MDNEEKVRKLTELLLSRAFTKLESKQEQAELILKTLGTMASAPDPDPYYDF